MRVELNFNYYDNISGCTQLKFEIVLHLSIEY